MNTRYEGEEITRVHGDQVVTERQRTAPPPVPDEPPQTAYRQKRTIFRTYQIVYYIMIVIEFLLGFRFLLKFLGANPNSGFAVFIYTLSYPFAIPFLTLFGIPSLGPVVFEWGTIFAMIFYFLLAKGIVKLFQVAKPTTPEEVESTVDKPEFRPFS